MQEVTARVVKLPDGTNLTVKVAYSRRFRFRIWLGTQLMKAAAAVMGCGINVEQGDPTWGCPNCHVDLTGVLYEHPWFEATDGGREPNTVNGPGESWMEGIQTCPDCGHKWEVSA